MQKVVLDNRRITIREVGDYVGISFGSHQAIFKDETYNGEDCSKIAKFEQKQNCMDIAGEMLTTFNDDPDFLHKVITGDESWVNGCDIETKTSRRAKTEKIAPSSIKYEGFFIVFLD